MSPPFVYHKCMDFKLDPYIRKVFFPVSRYGKYQSSISFSTIVTEQEAVEAVEKSLSRPITKSHFNLVKDDLFCCDKRSFKERVANGENMGDLLGDCIFLEDIDRVGDDPSHIMLGLGS